MNYPKLLQKGDTIGICAPSSGVSEDLFARFDNAIANIKALGYNVLEAPTVRNRVKCASSDAQTRAAEFMEMYQNPSVSAIIPPWGGEFLMEILPLLEFEKLAVLPPKWISGYSDITTLTFPLTINCDIATIHGSNSMNMGYSRIHESDLRVFEAMSCTKTVQHSADFWGNFSGWDITKETYMLDNLSVWKTLNGESSASFSGRMIGGCMDTLNVLVGTKYANISAFLEKYKSDGFIWTLESCEMTAAEIYRALWQMRENGWFRYCNGVIYGRPSGYADTRDFTLIDALERGVGGLNVPIIYDADIGHVPPILQIVNGAFGSVEFADGKAIMIQEVAK
ncbi:LD-carboxypeptidase [Clostridia bacterium]|nr:LD-carboxypeptidase [Clostridia bacterium]